MEVLKTKDYRKFIFVDRNREGGICWAHVNKLAESISSRNMLEFRPIECNSRMEIVDGQHRCKAAEKLGVDIYYTVNPEFKDLDMITLNINKQWAPRDFLNFYTKLHYPEYMKLNDFMKKNNLETRIAIKLSRGNSMQHLNDFKMGKFKFVEGDDGDTFDICWQTIDYIKKMNGRSPYTGTVKFWNSLIKLIRHVHFNKEKWFANMGRMIERFDVRAIEADYLRLFMEVHNWHNQKRIDLIEDY